MLVLEKWRKGLLGFGLAGALAGYLYSGLLTLPPIFRSWRRRPGLRRPYWRRWRP